MFDPGEVIAIVFIFYMFQSKMAVWHFILQGRIFKAFIIFIITCHSYSYQVKRIQVQMDQSYLQWCFLFSFHWWMSLCFLDALSCMRDRIERYLRGLHVKVDLAWFSTNKPGTIQGSSEVKQQDSNGTWAWPLHSLSDRWRLLESLMMSFKEWNSNSRHSRMDTKPSWLWYSIDFKLSLFYLLLVLLKWHTVFVF